MKWLIMVAVLLIGFSGGLVVREYSFCEHDHIFWCEVPCCSDCPDAVVDTVVSGRFVSPQTFVYDNPIRQYLQDSIAVLNERLADCPEVSISYELSSVQHDIYLRVIDSLNERLAYRCSGMVPIAAVDSFIFDKWNAAPYYPTLFSVTKKEWQEFKQARGL